MILFIDVVYFTLYVPQAEDIFELEQIITTQCETIFNIGHSRKRYKEINFNGVIYTKLQQENNLHPLHLVKIVVIKSKVKSIVFTCSL